MPERQFTQAKIVAALQALGDELACRDVRGQIFIVGGAAMALVKSATEALDILKRMYPLQEPPPKTRFFLEELFDAA